MRLKYFFPILMFSLMIIVVLYQAVLPSSTAWAKDGLDNSTIAGIEIDSTKKSEIQSLLSTEVAMWKQNDIVVQGTTAKVVIPSDYITFNITETVDDYISVTTSQWYNFWGSNQKIEAPIEITIDEKVAELLAESPLLYVDETLEAIKEHASYLEDGEVQAVEVELSKDMLERISFEIQEVVVDGTGISNVVAELDGTTILHNEQFSFLNILEDTESLYSSETVNFVASTLYSAVLQSELTIQERHSQNVMPKYLEPGIEAKVDVNRSQDFSFINRMNSPLIISASLKDGRLMIELYSFKSDYEITYEVRDKEIVKPRMIKRLTYDLPIGAEKVVENGKDGLRVHVYKIVTEINGAYTDEELISTDFYPPLNKVVLVSSKEPEPVVETTTDGENTEGQTEGQIVDPADPNGSTQSSNPSNPTSQDNTDMNDSTTGTGEENKGTKDTSENENGPESEESYYDKGGNLITPDSK